MDRKVLAILLILLAGAAFLTLGCTGKRDNMAPTQSPPAATSAPALTATPAPATGTDSGSIDESLLNITGEDNESLPESDIPTPDGNF